MSWEIPEGAGLPDPRNSIETEDVAEVEVIDHGDAE